jgi:hypothetical protein
MVSENLFLVKNFFQEMLKKILKRLNTSNTATISETNNAIYNVKIWIRNVIKYLRILSSI